MVIHADSEGVLAWRKMIILQAEGIGGRASGDIVFQVAPESMSTRGINDSPLPRETDHRRGEDKIRESWIDCYKVGMLLDED